jgi:hypothetical protein
MDIILDTRRHCIETACKKEYERLIRQYLKACFSEEEQILMGKKIEALSGFLQTTDFSDLRNQSTGSSGTSPVLVIPEASDDIHIRLGRKILHPVRKKP